MSIIKEGSSGLEVQILQRDLSILNYNTAIDGNFGPATTTALKQFQRDKNLTIDGIVGANTWALLDYLVPHGIDISHHNTGIDCSNLPPHIQFVYCKASQGKSFKDGTFQSNIQKLKQKNVINGAYHFITFNATAIEQVDNFLSSGYDFSNAATLPPALDVEWQVGANGAETNALNQYIKNHQQECINLVADILRLVAEKTSRTPIVYTAKSFMSEFLHNTTAFSNYPLWIPAYQDTPPGLPPGWNKYTIWQYFGASDGSAGISDRNVFNGNFDDLKAFANA